MQNPNDLHHIFIETRRDLYFCASYVEYRRTIPEKLQNLDMVCFKIRCKVIETDNQRHPTDSGAVLAVLAEWGSYCTGQWQQDESLCWRTIQSVMKRGLRNV